MSKVKNKEKIMSNSLTPKEKKVLQKFKQEVIKKFPNQILEVKIFGSKARGNAKVNSDIDALVITKTDDWHLSDKIGEIAYELLLESGIYISTKVIGEKHFKYLIKLKAPFIRNVIKESFIL